MIDDPVQAIHHWNCNIYGKLKKSIGSRLQISNQMGFYLQCSGTVIQVFFLILKQIQFDDPAYSLLAHFVMPVIPL